MSGRPSDRRFSRGCGDKTARDGLLVGALALTAFFTTIDSGCANEPDRPALKPSVGGESPPAALPVASAIRIVRFGETTRIAFDVTSHLDVRAFVMAEPDRVIVDVPETIFAIDSEAGQRKTPVRGKKPASGDAAPSGLIGSYRFGKLGPGRSRVVIDLDRPARIAKAETEVSEEGRLRLLVDLVPTDRAAFTADAADAARENAAPSAMGVAIAQPSATTKPVVVIDPGHGGIDSGALAKGRAPEKEIVFEFARALEAVLVQTGRYQVVMTRTEDVFVPLGQRVQIARTANAQLLLSIHADTLNEGGVSGATVYTVSDKASDAHAARLAEKENFADKVAGADGVEEGGGVSDILFDLARRETRAYSHVFARTLVSVWKDAARLNKNPIRSAGFTVLKAPDVPSALLELGYLSSEKDSALLSDPQWRAKTAKAVANSIDRFFAMRSPGNTAEDNAGVASITP